MLFDPPLHRLGDGVDVAAHLHIGTDDQPNGCPASGAGVELRAGAAVRVVAAGVELTGLVLVALARVGLAMGLPVRSLLEGGRRLALTRGLGAGNGALATQRAAVAGPGVMRLGAL